MTTDNMRKTIGKTNYSITFTTAYPTFAFYSATIVCTATSGTFRGVHLHVTGSGIGGNIDGLRLEVHAAALTPGQVWVNGAKISAECDAASYVSAWLIGLYLNIGGQSDSVIQAAAGLYLDSNINVAVTGEHYFIYLRNNRSAYPLTAYFALYGGADYFIHFNVMTQGDAASRTGDTTAGGASGSLKIDYYGEDRYIQLYVGPPL